MTNDNIVIELTKSQALMLNLLVKDHLFDLQERPSGNDIVDNLVKELLIVEAVFAKEYPKMMGIKHE